jgi:hypothetical protein
MSVKKIPMPQLGSVAFNKRRNSRSIRITLSHSGEVKVSLPKWVSYFEAQRFVASKTDWILSQKVKVDNKLLNYQTIGKYHRLVFVPVEKYLRPRGSVSKNEVTIKYPAELEALDESVQTAARRAANKALMNEAKQSLPGRLTQLAEENDFRVSDIKIKLLKSRWGSCNSHNEITLNSHLMLLPWHLVDYVLMHELIHTKVMKHGPQFWDEFKRYEPDALALRKEIKNYRPTI